MSKYHPYFMKVKVLLKIEDTCPIQFLGFKNGAGNVWYLFYVLCYVP